VPILDAEREDFWRAVIPEPETANADPGAGAVE
jgi:hypothetical protein